MKKLIPFLFAGCLMVACNSQMDHESLSNPDQSDDPNARNEEALRAEDSMNALSTVPSEVGDSSMKSEGSR